MSEPAVSWDAPIGVAPRRLRPAGGGDVLLADFRAKVRAAGHGWDGGKPGDVMTLLAEAAAGDPELIDLVHRSGSLLQDFLDGYRTRGAEPVPPTSQGMASELIDGNEIAPEAFAGLSANYRIVVARFPDSGVPALQEAAGPGVLVTRRDCGLVMLVPDLDAERTARITKQLTQRLAGRGWLAWAARPKNQIADGFAEAADVLRLVAAGRRPCGAYTIADVLVEYAVTRHDQVTDHLVAVIEPLRAQPVLWETLTSLIDADYNRNKAARNLFIHRSTLDYRLQRIAGITGCDPTSGRGVQVLTAAVIADAVAASR